MFICSVQLLATANVGQYDEVQILFFLALSSYLHQQSGNNHKWKKQWKKTTKSANKKTLKSDETKQITREEIEEAKKKQQNQVWY